MKDSHHRLNKLYLINIQSWIVKKKSPVLLFNWLGGAVRVFAAAVLKVLVSIFGSHETVL